MNLFRKFFKPPTKEINDEPPTMPWDRRPSILQFIRSHIDGDKSGLSDGGELLPDEIRFHKDFSPGWKPGAFDGVLTHHTRKREDKKVVNRAIELLIAYSQEPTFVNKAAVYQFILEEKAVRMVDALLDAILTEPRINLDRLYELAYSFATESQDREPVKMGISILGLFDQPANSEFLMTLGRHEEFTLYSAIAIGNLSGDDESMLWKLAQNVRGWGRIHVVERLAKTRNPEIKNWLVREGFRNTVHYEYLAAICAAAGGLTDALCERSVDRQLLTSAGEIIQALIHGGLVASIDDLKDGAFLVEEYLSHIDVTGTSLADLLHVLAINAFLCGDDETWQTRMNRGWTNERRASLQRRCRSILDREESRNLIRAALQSTNEATFNDANEAANVLGIDTWCYHWDRLQKKPDDLGCWRQIMNLCNDERINLVIAFAEECFEWIRNVGWDENRDQSRSDDTADLRLERVLQELCRYPGRGTALIVAGLKSQLASCRQMAVAVLASWPRGRWPGGFYDSLKLAAIVESDCSVREQMKRVLDGVRC
jgi:hypothetical protein